jgi:hypothetical protein
MPGLTELALAASVVFAGVQPHLAAVGDRVFLVFGQGESIGVARSADAGKTFGTTVTVPVSGRMSVGMHRGPKIAGTRRALLVSAVVGAKGGGADGDVVLYRSTDEGATWSPAIAINDVPGSAREGLHAMAALPSGLVVIAWLDLRQAGTRIYAAVSRDHGVTWAPDALVYASPGGAVCECCHPSIAINNDNDIAIMFRNNLDGNRDMYVARSSDRVTFRPAVKLGTGSWALNACPMDGGAVTFEAANLVAVWRRENQVYLTTTTEPERLLGPGRDAVVDHSDGAHRDIAWSAPEGVVLARGDAAPIALGPGRFPSVLAFAGATVVAWEHQGQVMVRAMPR